MGLREIVIFCGLIAAGAVACAGDAFPPQFDPPPQRRFVPGPDSVQGPPELPMKKLIVVHERKRKANHFCVIGYEWPDGVTNVWVHWKEGQRLIIWRGSKYPEMREDSLALAPSLEWGKDTVETTAQIAGSTYLVTKAWWRAVADDCAKHGRKVLIKPF